MLWVAQRVDTVCFSTVRTSIVTKFCCKLRAICLLEYAFISVAAEEHDPWFFPIYLHCFISLVFASTGYVQDIACAFFDKIDDYTGKVRSIPCTNVYKYGMWSVINKDGGVSLTWLRRVLCSLIALCAEVR
jgi:hypothetical protein